MEENPIEADGIKLVTDSGQVFELWPRKSDGEVHLSVKNKLAIRPMAANLIQILDLK